MKNLFRVGVIGLVVSACGGSDAPSFGPEQDPTPAQQAAINTSAQYLTLIAGADVQGEAAAGAAISFAFAAQALVGAEFGPSAALPRAAFAGCPVVSANSAVWDHCTDGKGTVIDGMMSWSPGHVDVDLHLSSGNPTLQLAWSFTGALTVSDTAIQGAMTVSFEVTGSGSHASETIHSEIDVQVVNHCIAGGMLAITASGSGSGARSGAVQVIWTGCNMFRVRNS